VTKIIISTQYHKSPVGFRPDATIKKANKNTIVRENFLVDSIFFIQYFFLEPSLYRHWWSTKINFYRNIQKSKYESKSNK